MMAKEFEQFKKMLEQNLSDNKLQQIYERLFSERGFFLYVGSLTREWIIELYSLRYALAVEGGFEVDREGFDKLLQALAESISKNVELYSVTFGDCYFLMFFDSSEGNLLGILKSILMNVGKMKSLQKIYIEKGVDTSCTVEFEKGVLIGNVPE